MSTIRTLVIVAVLAGVAYLVYATLTVEPPGEPPVPIPENLGQGPEVSLEPESEGMPVDVPKIPWSSGGGDAPPFDPGQTGPTGQTPANLGGAPPFNPQAAPPSARYQPPAGSGAAQATGSGNPPPLVPGVAMPPGDYGDSPGGSAAASTTPRDAAYDYGTQSRTTPPSGVVPANGVSTAGADTQAGFPAVWSEIHNLLDDGQFVEAHRLCSEWFDDPSLTPQQSEQVALLLDQLAGTVIYSVQSYLEPPYVVQPGDTLQEIAKPYNVPWQLLAKVNGIQDPQRLRPGSTIKVLRGPFSVLVELEKYRLTLWLDGLYAGSFRVGVGSDQSTPIGDFQVAEKIENPTYYGQDVTIDRDDPANPLGERWIGLSDASGAQHGIGIHGTNDPSTIGTAASRGCIRLAPHDAEDLHDILSMGSQVIIRR